jgi:hypothetical protein
MQNEETNKRELSVINFVEIKGRNRNLIGVAPTGLFIGIFLKNILLKA